jgi:pyruvate dehydrogenase E1 component beta subunit
MARQLKFTEAIKEALHTAMQIDDKVICFGLGVDDPKYIFGTTEGLKESYGSERVFDMPTSENAMTGVAIGASIMGLRSVMVHQRMDFFLLAMDQLVNNAAKWHYMFDGQMSAGITIRLIVGQGWGQGPTHSQNLHSWFAHIPGLKVVMPTSPGDAKGLLLTSIFDPNPVIFIEHRWLHGTQGVVPEQAYRIPFAQAKYLSRGDDLTIISTSYLTVEAQYAIEHMQQLGVTADLIDLRTIKPIDWGLIFESVEKTGRLLVLDAAHSSCSIASDIIATISTEKFKYLKQAPQRLTFPDVPSPTSFSLTKNYYPRAENIVEEIEKILDKNLNSAVLRMQRSIPHDIPGDWFNGPF